VDFNEFLKDTEVGSTVFDLAKLKEDGKQRGELRFDVFYFPVLKPQVNESGVEELPKSSELCRYFSYLFSHSKPRLQVWASCDLQSTRPRTLTNRWCTARI
jgi:hypothetical protein